MKNILGHIGALLVVTIWGTTFVSSKVLLNSGLTPADIFVCRFIMAYCCMAIISHKRLWADNWKDELTLFGLGIMGGSMYFLTENMALVYSTTANVSILVSTSPLITALLIAIFYKSERLSKIQCLGSVIAFMGAALVILNGQLLLHINPLGDTLALSAALTWGFYSLFMRRIMGRYRSDFITRKVFFYGILTIIPYFMFIHPFGWKSEYLHSPLIIANMLFLGIIASTVCYLLWNWVMQKLGAIRSTNYIYIQSVITMIAGWLILGEHITWMAILGTLLLIGGMILAQKKKKEHTEQASL